MPSGKKPVVVVGSINIDLVANTERIPVEGETFREETFRFIPEARAPTRRSQWRVSGIPCA
jgi:hypothetical protein